MTDSVLLDFLASPIRERLRLVTNKSHADVLQTYLGRRAYGEYEQIAERSLSAISEDHLSIHSTKNLIFIPGIMGSLLQSKHLGGVWWIDVRSRHAIERLRLAPDGLNSANPDYEVTPFAIDMTYEAFLAAALQRDDFGVVEFPYDWRKSLKLSTNALREKILDVFATNGGEPIHLVAHSMGGLLIRATLSEYGDELWDKVGKIVFLGTPHYGSPAIAWYLKNHLGGFNLLELIGRRYLSRETFRSLHGALALLPAPIDIYPKSTAKDHPCADFDLYDADAWQLDLSKEETGHLQAILNNTAAFHRQLHQAHRKLDQSYRDRMAVIAGVGYKTLFRLTLQEYFGGTWTHLTKETARVVNNPHREGDGRVPLASALLESVGETRYVRGVHQSLPTIRGVYEDVFRWLSGEPMQLSESQSQALAEHLDDVSPASETPYLNGTGQVIPGSEDPGYWDFGPIDESDLQSLNTHLESGSLPEFVTTRLL